MPSVFLSPSTQEFNPYITSGDEEYFMNLIADAMIPYLQASNVDFSRNDPDQPLSAAIEASNAGGYDLHLALHSNASPEYLSGMLQGPDVYYYEGSQPGATAAEIVAGNLRYIYPYPELVTVLPTTSLAELRRTAAPSVLVEIAYHDNWEDALWIENNIQAIARNLALSVTEFLGVPFVDPY
ncbi:MAG: N-acetylmuramoyl-L-alanine amidase [Bacillota bacterium]|nr:N-acetylmuramoyl-L-alanine amidase [Bacillota bacterium]